MRAASRKYVCMTWKFCKDFCLGSTIFLMAATSGYGVAQTCGADEAQTIATVRPQVTNSSVAVPCGSLQFENGVTETGNTGTRTYDMTETMVRWGVYKKTELNLIVPSYYKNAVTAMGTASGAGDVTVGMKQQFKQWHGVDYSVAPFVSLPSGSSAITSHGYDGGVQIPWSRVMSKNWTANGMLAVSWPTVAARHNATGVVTLYMDRQLTKTIDGWVEYAGIIAQRGGTQNIADFGLGYHPTPHQQIDVRYGRGMSAAAPDYFVGAGYSVRFQVYRAKKK